MKKFWSLLLVVALVLSCASMAFAEEDLTELPRNETVYTAGQQWGSPNNFNIFALSNQAWPIGDTDRFPIYEALYMYNMITNENEPLIADGQPEWEDDYNFIVKIKDNVHFSDGTPLTSADVAYTYNIADEANGGVYTTWSNIWTYFEKVEAVDDYTVRFTIKEEPYNKVMPISKLANVRIVSKAISEALFEECGNEVAKVREQFVENPIGTGAFKLAFYDDTRIVCERDDNYWGQAENMFGKLTEVKYYCHPIYNDNAAGNLALANGEVDISQQFVNDVGALIETGNYKTFYDEAPYQLGYGSPSLLFNLQKDGLKDPVIHHAIARCLDYEAIAQNAMSGQTEQMTICFLNPTLYGDYIDFDDEELAELMWDTTAVDDNLADANAMLDEAGYIDVDGDGFREMPDGSKIEWKAECPTGWSDWNASLEILCESAKKIGLNIVTHFPESSEYTLDYQTGNFDILMNSPYGSPSSAQPYEACYSVLYSKDVPAIGSEATHNYNRYTNEDVDALIEDLGATEDPDEMKEYVTAIVKQWLTDMPTVQLMYRPNMFHTVYTGVWTGWSDSTSDVPPEVLTDGAAIRDLYNIHPVESAN
ncbi:MAG: ABC transporter substrate-binding protein [Clostridia bacterium]|nr:ABC transporter substrate-binding protein [Clostridia bacterium]